LIIDSDCIAGLKMFPDNYFSSVVTDPPYGLSDHSAKDFTDCLTAWLAGEEYRPKKKGFMGRAWDSWVPGPEAWREVYRVLKPGAYVLAFAGSRTHDLMSLSMRLAGFECRDTLMWVYGSGFPKSMDVSKAIDAQDAVAERRARSLRFTEWMRSTGLSASLIDVLTGSQMGGHYLTAAAQPAVPTRAHMDALRPYLPPVPDWAEQLVTERAVESENMKARPVIGVKEGVAAGWDMDGSTTYVDRDITTPHSEEAQRWEGWGTSLKPAWEPVLMFRKPPDGTIAANVLAHGVGGLNIDGCRVGEPPEARQLTRNASMGYGGSKPQGAMHDGGAGRFPANLMHDGSDEVLALFPDSNGSGGSVPRVKISGYGDGIGSGASEYLGGERTKHDAGAGSAARFFYSAKASRADRDEGLEGFALRENANWPQSLDGNDARGASPRANNHPTVKPTALMRYLCRLVTPPGGIVADPFAGSGSTGKAAALEGFEFVGFELDADHARVANARVDAARRQRIDDAVNKA
jgi:DNA modification methylase